MEEIEDPSKSIRPPSGNIGQVHRSTWSQNVTQNDLCHCLSPLPFITSSYVHCLQCTFDLVFEKCQGYPGLTRFHEEVDGEARDESRMRKRWSPRGPRGAPDTSAVEAMIVVALLVIVA